MFARERGGEESERERVGLNDNCRTNQTVVAVLLLLPPPLAVVVVAQCAADAEGGRADEGQL